MLPRLPGKRLLFRLNAAPVHANHANRASAFAVSRIIDPSRLADPKAFVNPDYFASDSTKPDYALIALIVVGATAATVYCCDRARRRRAGRPPRPQSQQPGKAADQKSAAADGLHRRSESGKPQDGDADDRHLP